MTSSLTTNSNTNPGQDWSHDFHFTFLCNTTHSFFNTLTDFFLSHRLPSALQKFFPSPSFPYHHDPFFPYTHRLFLAPRLAPALSKTLQTHILIINLPF